MMKTKLIAFGVTSIIIAIAIFLGYWLSYQAQTPTKEIQTTTGEVKEFTIYGSTYNFNPSTITVNRGDVVRITFISTDIGHNLFIDGYNIGTSILSGGASETIEFVADKAGTFAFYCSVPGHRAAGMEGKLIVV